MGSITLRVVILEEEDASNIKEQRIIRRNLRDRSNPMKLSNYLYQKYYSVNKYCFNYLLEVLTSSLPIPKKSCAAPAIIKLSACLRFFAEGGYQTGVGKDHEVGLAQSSFSVVLSQVLEIFEEKLCPQWINML